MISVGGGKSRIIPMPVTTATVAAMQSPAVPYIKISAVVGVDSSTQGDGASVHAIPNSQAAILIGIHRTARLTWSRRTKY